ncbi:MAG: hypothetical protein AAB439_03910 [Patescibacteria group bacterium]
MAIIGSREGSAPHESSVASRALQNPTLTWGFLLAAGATLYYATDFLVDGVRSEMSSLRLVEEIDGPTRAHAVDRWEDETCLGNLPHDWKYNQDYHAWSCKRIGCSKWFVPSWTVGK